MRKRFFMIAKDVWATKFMQATGTFEPDKFVGITQEASGVFEKPVSEVLTNMAKKNDDKYAVVGIIVPNGEAAFLPEHNVISINGKWITTKDLCTNMGAVIHGT